MSKYHSSLFECYVLGDEFQRECLDSLVNLACYELAMDWFECGKVKA